MIDAPKIFGLISELSSNIKMVIFGNKWLVTLTSETFLIFAENILCCF